MATPTNARHSAVVEMELRIGDLVIPIGQMGRDTIMTRHPTEHPPAYGTIVTTIDGKIKTGEVFLPNGITTQERWTKVVAANAADRVQPVKAA